MIKLTGLFRKRRKPVSQTAQETKKPFIHKTVRTLPIVTAIDIANTGDLTLLTDQPEAFTAEELVAIWEEIEFRWNELAGAGSKSKHFNIYKEVQYQSNRYNIILDCCAALRFDRSQKCIEILKENNYIIRDRHYMQDIERAERECQGILNVIANLEKSLPKQTGDDSGGFSIIDSMAAYSAILVLDFDYYTCSIEKYYAMEKQVKAKVAAMKQPDKKKK